MTCNCYSFYRICDRGLGINFLVLSSVFLQFLIYCHIYITVIKDCVIYTIAALLYDSKFQKVKIALPTDKREEKCFEIYSPENFWVKCLNGY